MALVVYSIPIMFREGLCLILLGVCKASNLHRCLLPVPGNSQVIFCQMSFLPHLLSFLLGLQLNTSFFTVFFLLTLVCVFHLLTLCFLILKIFFRTGGDLESVSAFQSLLNFVFRKFCELVDKPLVALMLHFKFLYHRNWQTL